MAYLVKPFSLPDLVPAIEIAVSRHQEITALEGEVADLGERLAARKAIDRAKAILIEHQQLSESDAFKAIQRQAMDERTTMGEVAKALIAQYGS
jgi:response regulator NasT